MPTLYPLLLQPTYKDYLWGGDTIIRQFNRSEPPGTYAESWELSDRSDGMSVVRNGPKAGTPLADIIADWGSSLLGSDAPNDKFPLLIKLIDSQQRLSVQVHPNDETAAQHGGDAKTECWYVLAAEPDAAVYAGFRDGVTQEDYHAAVKKGETGELLNRLLVAAGDVIFIPGGLVHAIDAGCLILEVQQNSNTTYRIDDWGRVGPDGKPRELHVEQAAQVIRWDATGSPKVKPAPIYSANENSHERLVVSPYFQLMRIRLTEPEAISGAGRAFVVLFVARGEVDVAWPGGSEHVTAGTSCLIPAALEGVTLTPTKDDTEVIHITLPETNTGTYESKVDQTQPT